MGCGYSKSFINLSQTRQYHQWEKTFNALKITREEVSEFHRQFEKVDFNGMGLIGIDELLKLFEIEKTAYSERVFRVFDDDGSGTISFYEFVLALWNYCTLTKVTLPMFAFDLYDTHSAGYLDKKNIDQMFSDIYGKDEKTNPNVKR